MKPVTVATDINVMYLILKIVRRSRRLIDSHDQCLPFKSQLHNTCAHVWHFFNANTEIRIDGLREPSNRERPREYGSPTIYTNSEKKKKTYNPCVVINRQAIRIVNL